MTKFLFLIFVLLSSCAMRKTSLPKAVDDVSIGWVDLREGMLLRIENAYYKEGAARRGIANYLGTETLSLQVMPTGKLKQLELLPLAILPTDQSSVSALMPDVQQQERFHRFYFQVVVNKKSGTSNALLLSSKSKAGLEQLVRLLASDPGSACGGKSQNCTVFPEACSVSLGIEIIVNGRPTKVAWTSTLASIVGKRKQFSIQRRQRGKLVRVELDPEDPEALRLPLLPGDTISW